MPFVFGSWLAVRAARGRDGGKRGVRVITFIAFGLLSELGEVDVVFASDFGHGVGAWCVV